EHQLRTIVAQHPLYRFRPDQQPVHRHRLHAVSRPAESSPERAWPGRRRDVLVCPQGQRSRQRAARPSLRRATGGLTGYGTFTGAGAGGDPGRPGRQLGLVGGGGVAPASGITRVNKDLVVPQRGRPGTWRLLDTVRAFATERLQAAGEEAHAQERHLSGFATHAADLAQPIGGQWRHHLGVAAVTSGPPWRAAPPPPYPGAET